MKNGKSVVSSRISASGKTWDMMSQQTPMLVMREKTAAAFHEETEKQKRLRIGSHRL